MCCILAISDTVCNILHNNTEGMGATSALKRSWSLVKGRWCYVFGIKFLVGLVVLVVVRLWSSLVAPPHFTFSGFIVGAIPSALMAPYLSVLVTVIYINLRVEKEGLDAQALAQDLGEPDDEAEMTSNENSDDDEPAIADNVPVIV